ncbi:MAG: hypothetical protein WBG70_19550 [Spirulinaceae cyanobacterium]
MHNRVPLMYQAQLPERGKIQYAGDEGPAAKWIEQWLEGCPPVPSNVDEKIPLYKRRSLKPEVKMPEFGPEVETKDYTFSWRFVTDAGQDEGCIRPVIGAKGLPFIPGSSMKGAFLRHCPQKKKLKYCGGEVREKGEIKMKPGILRFHGAYPVDMSWAKRKRLMDIIHPQQERQVMENKTTSAHVQISLYQPTLRFGISSSKKLTTQEWQEVWAIWEQALGEGMGSRVSAGYGQVTSLASPKKPLLAVHLQGQGLASQLLNNTPEFRPNMFKAALRGHTLRWLAGVTDKETALALTKQLWGGIDGEAGAIVGKLGVNFVADEENLQVGKYRYDLQKGELAVHCLAKVSTQEKKELRKLVRQIIRFSLLLGGFGKSWRRIDHELFFPSYVNNSNNPGIGCHWQFAEESEKLYLPVHSLKNVTDFLDYYQNLITEWVQSNRKTTGNSVREWREAWHPSKVQVWGRIAQSERDSTAIYWLHGPYSGKKSIKNTALTGKIGQIGRLWHRMYPRYKNYRDKSSGEIVLRSTGEYIELLTLFPDESQTTTDFLRYLYNVSDFELLFGEIR